MQNDRDLSTDNPMFKQVHQPGIGPYLVPGHPAAFSALDRNDPVPAPILGQHTEEVLGDVVGMTDTEVAQLFDAGVVQSPTFAAPRTAA